MDEHGVSFTAKLYPPGSTVSNFSFQCPEKYGSSKNRLAKQQNSLAKDMISKIAVSDS